MQFSQGPLKAVIGYFQVVACFEFDKWWVLVAVRVDVRDEARRLFCAGRAVRHGASENRHVAHGVANFAEVKVFEAVIVELEFESVGVEPAFAREVSQVVGSAFCAAGSVTGFAAFAVVGASLVTVGGGLANICVGLSRVGLSARASGIVVAWATSSLLRYGGCSAPCPLGRTGLSSCVLLL